MLSKIAVIGLRSDPVIVNFAARATLRGHEPYIMDLRRVAEEGEWRLHAPARVGDWIALGDEKFPLAAMDGIYIRMINLSTPRTPEAHRWNALFGALRVHLLSTQAKVINPPIADTQNSAKPLHEAWLASKGMNIPATVTSADPDVLADFCKSGRAIAKPISGVRAHAREVTAEDFLGKTFRGPVHLQRMIKGNDVRAHVVGQEVFSCAFASQQADYRRDRKRTEWITELEPQLAQRIVELTAAQGLIFAGWDFKVDQNGDFWCLEANPMPGYAFYDRIMDGAITDGLLRYLTTREASLPFLPRSLISDISEKDPAGFPRHGDHSYGLIEQCSGETHFEWCSERCRERLNEYAARVVWCHEILDYELDSPSRWFSRTRREVLEYGRADEGSKYRACLEWILENPPMTIDLDYVLEVHDRAVGGRGLRKFELRVPTRIPSSSSSIERDLRAALGIRHEESPPVAAANVHLDMLEIHPFPDGNGRTSRLIATAFLVQGGYRSRLLIDTEGLFAPYLYRYLFLLYAFHAGAICRTAYLSGWLGELLGNAEPVAWLSEGCRPLDVPMALAHLRKLEVPLTESEGARLIGQLGKRLEELASVKRHAE